MILAQAFARFCFDLDGVIWRGDQPIPGAVETLRSLREGGKSLCFVTNNSSETHETYAKRLTDIGAVADPNDVVTSADATARVLEHAVPGMRGRLVYVLGGDGLRDAVVGLGARLAGEDDASDASVVVVGWDRALTFDTLRAATHAIRTGATFVASNADATFPAPEGFWPGAGAIVAALRTATGIDPLIAGKPDPTVLQIARERLGGAPALAVGDRIETDVLAAHAAGWPAALVLTGAAGIPDLAVAPAWPEYLLSSVSDLLEDRPHPSIRAAAGPDLPHIATILHAGGQRSGAARERIGRTVIAEIERTPIATAAWEPAGDAVVLRAVGVAEDQRGRGVGRLVVAAALREAFRAGHRDIYAAVGDAVAFFETCGFVRADHETIPAAVAASIPFAREAPPDAVPMWCRLPAPATT